MRANASKVTKKTPNQMLKKMNKMCWKYVKREWKRGYKQNNGTSSNISHTQTQVFYICEGALLEVTEIDTGMCVCVPMYVWIISVYKTKLYVTLFLYMLNATATNWNQQIWPRKQNTLKVKSRERRREETQQKVTWGKEYFGTSAKSATNRDH